MILAFADTRPSCSSPERLAPVDRVPAQAPYNYWLQYIGLNHSTIKYLGTDLAEFTPGQSISLTSRVRYDRQDCGRLDIESEFPSKPEP